ncbi:GSCOCG00008478001-RA-CDS [Cotesia congregata]|nr:GSCOCG00008478001-RA-CDS [Cotesia congregata]
MRSSLTFRYFKFFAALGTGGILACCLLMYLLLDLTFTPKKTAIKDSVENNQWVHLENRLTKLEEDLSNHHKVIDSIKEASNSIQSGHHSVNNKKNNDFTASKKLLTCNFNIEKAPEVDIQMLDLYRQLEFDNPDGGVWKQGWAIRYDEKQWHPKRKLKVFVVPHSHNDPGWLDTFEKYYAQKTQRILNNMVMKLAEDKRRKFIWAEISFFKLWWDEQTKATREMVKRLIVDGQLEIVAGGWVMPDEAVSHWMAQLTQLTVGHQWLKTNLDYQPTSGWAIDPFGLSPTMPYLLKSAGLENILIQRVHYAVKKRLARDKHLEFRWRQLWDTTGSTEILTHLMPFYSYDVPHTCGPDPKICCQFDFFRLPNFGLSCPWRVPPQTITKKNVAMRAQLLLDQYRKKSQLFKSNVVLAPLGDDFRYAQSSEWDAQFGNYQKLFDYMNKNEQLNVDIQFGTLTDYFNALRDEQNINELPSLSGDFFTYADENQDYWSGYYTSRPFHKRLDRVLLGALRGAEILSAIAWARGHEHLAESTNEKRMVEARQWHSLFQHHDGVTGTARDDVVIDYAQKMINSLNNTAHIIQQSAAHLLRSAQGPALQPESLYFSLDEVRSHHTSIGERYVLALSSDQPSKKVIIYNSLPRQRTKVQTIIISTPYVRVTDRMGQSVQCQISPVWVGPVAMSGARYELSFVVTLPGFGLNTYLIHSVYNNNLPESVYLANITLFNTAIPPSNVPGFADVKVLPSTQEFSITQRPEISASFSKSGLLKAIKIGETTVPVHLEFVKYGTQGIGHHRSGAYLFIPDKSEPDPIYMNNDRTIHLVTGPILSRVFIQLPHVKHTYTLFNSPGSDGLGLHISNEVDITETQNFELAMRLSTNIASGDQFFTDLNGLNMIKRQRFPKLPTQANYYPLPAAGYIEDKKVRLTVITGQPLGASSMASGQFEIMQDRRLMQDDRRGLEQGVIDNLLTNHQFMLVLEKKKQSCSSSPVPNHPAGILSIGGLLASEELLHPLVAMHPHPSSDIDYNGHFSPLRFDLPVDLSIVNLRVFPVPEGAGKGVGMVLHREPIDICWSEELISSRFNISNNGEINLTKFFNFIEDWTISEAPLTFSNVGPSLKSPTINLCPHQLSAILFHKTQS